MIVLIEQDEGYMVDWMTFESPIDHVLFIDYSEALENPDYCKEKIAEISESPLPEDISTIRISMLELYLEMLT